MFNYGISQETMFFHIRKSLTMPMSCTACTTHPTTRSLGGHYLPSSCEPTLMLRFEEFS